MKNIKAFKGKPITFHKEIIDSLNNGKTKSNLVDKEKLINSLYNDYQSKFDTSDLVSLTAYGFKGENKTDLLKLYSSQRKPLQELRVELTTKENNQRDNTCPNCTIEIVNSLDHFIPKEKFPEFSVNPINLIPCCPTCNSKKKDNWRKNDKMLFLNLYSDSIPKEQYLFVNITSKIDFEFIVNNRNSIDADLFEIIKSHYKELNLCQRFRENADNVISELDETIENYSEYLSDKILYDAVYSHYNKREQKLGINNWEIVLVKAMLESAIYF